MRWNQYKLSTELSGKERRELSALVDYPRRFTLDEYVRVARKNIKQNPDDEAMRRLVMAETTYLELNRPTYFCGHGDLAGMLATSHMDISLRSLLSWSPGEEDITTFSVSWPDTFRVKGRQPAPIIISMFSHFMMHCYRTGPGEAISSIVGTQDELEASLNYSSSAMEGVSDYKIDDEHVRSSVAMALRFVVYMQSDIATFVEGPPHGERRTRGRHHRSYTLPTSVRGPVGTHYRSGHFRTLKAARFGDNRGKIIYVRDTVVNRVKAETVT